MPPSLLSSEPCNLLSRQSIQPPAMTPPALERRRWSTRRPAGPTRTQWTRRWPPAEMRTPSSGSTGATWPGSTSLARRMLSDDDADEVAQDVFVRAWQKLGTFRGEAAFGTWLHRLAVNVILGRRETLGIRRQRYLEGDAALEMVPARRHDAGDGHGLRDGDGAAAGGSAGGVRAARRGRLPARGDRPRCSASRPAPRSPSCTGRAWRCGSISSGEEHDMTRPVDRPAVRVPRRRAARPTSGRRSRRTSRHCAGLRRGARRPPADRRPGPGARGPPAGADLWPGIAARIGASPATADRRRGGHRRRPAAAPLELLAAAARGRRHRAHGALGRGRVAAPPGHLDSRGRQRSRAEPTVTPGSRRRGAERLVPSGSPVAARGRPELRRRRRRPRAGAGRGARPARLPPRSGSSSRTSRPSTAPSPRPSAPWPPTRPTCTSTPTWPKRCGASSSCCARPPRSSLRELKGTDRALRPGQQRSHGARARPADRHHRAGPAGPAAGGQRLRRRDRRQDLERNAVRVEADPSSRTSVEISSSGGSVSVRTRGPPRPAVRGGPHASPRRPGWASTCPACTPT